MTGVHAGQTLVRHGAAAEAAAGALILIHGRGGNAAGILGFADLVVGPGIACLAPQAAGHSWYPNRFIAPVAMNEPHLSSALSVLDDLVAQLGEAGLPPARVALLGFSQGACLALEFARRRAIRLAAVIGLSGGLIGDVVGAAEGDLTGTRIFLGCAERDAHIPVTRVHETDIVLRGMGADVTTKIYPGTDHGINPDEVARTKHVLAAAFA